MFFSCIAHSAGQFRFACGRQYFISNASVPLLTAYEECCKYGLKLLSVESAEEVNCIAEMNAGSRAQNPSKFLLHVRLNFTAEVKVTNKYWTSGTNVGYGCDFKHGWCTSRKFFASNNLTWTPSNHLTERCMELNLNGVLTRYNFNDLPCTFQRHFICEVLILIKKYRFLACLNFDPG